MTLLKNIENIYNKPIKPIIGPLTDISGIKMNGSFFMVEAETEEEIHEFQKNDPIYKAGVGKKLSYHHLIRE